jgi:hypothetical protein
MERVIEAPLNPRKKISLNVDTTMLNLVKDLADLTSTNNTLIIDALLKNGVSPLINQFTTSWVTLLGDTEDEKRKKILKDLLQKLQETSEKKEYTSLV